MKKKLTHARGLKFILSAFICILPQRLPNLRPQQTGGSSPSQRGNPPKTRIWRKFGDILDLTWPGSNFFTTASIPDFSIVFRTYSSRAIVSAWFCVNSDGSLCSSVR